VPCFYSCCRAAKTYKAVQTDWGWPSFSALPVQYLLLSELSLLWLKITHIQVRLNYTTALWTVAVYKLSRQPSVYCLSTQASGRTILCLLCIQNSSCSRPTHASAWSSGKWVWLLWRFYSSNNSQLVTREQLKINGILEKCLWSSYSRVLAQLYIKMCLYRYENCWSAPFI
jgi:hypothetical protein